MEARVNQGDSALPWRLRATGVGCERGERRLFSDFDLMLASGDVVWLRAANGFGKTSLLRILAGLAQPAAGSLEWHEPRQPMLYLAHANAIKDDLTIVEALRYLARLHGLASSEAALADAIGRFGLQSRRHAPIRTLSQGQRRRVALARLCLSAPRATWLLDEPFDALDSEGAALVGNLLADHATRGGCVVFTSHIAPDLADLTVRSIQIDALPATRIAA